MKPNFALSLSHEGIRLVHRSKSGWMPVGEAALDDPQLLDRLKVLRKTAVELESGGFLTKLVLPDSQVLYTTVPAPGPDDDSRLRQIRMGLEGLTPYDVSDLVFDWRPEGAYARVALLARETLDEAEAFAAEHRMNPISYVAQPDESDFPGEPFFGPARHAASLLDTGETVEPDDPNTKYTPPAAPEPAKPAPAAAAPPPAAQPRTNPPQVAVSQAKSSKPTGKAPPPPPGLARADTSPGSARNRFRLKKDVPAVAAAGAAGLSGPAAAGEKPASRFAPLRGFSRGGKATDTPGAAAPPAARELAVASAAVPPPSKAMGFASSKSRAAPAAKTPPAAAPAKAAEMPVAQAPAFSTRRDRTPAKPAPKGKRKSKAGTKPQTPVASLDHARGRLEFVAPASGTPGAPADGPARSRAVAAAAAAGPAKDRSGAQPNGPSRNGFELSPVGKSGDAQTRKFSLPTGKAISDALAPMMGRGKALVERARKVELPKLPKPAPKDPAKEKLAAGAAPAPAKGKAATAPAPAKPVAKGPAKPPAAVPKPAKTPTHPASSDAKPGAKVSAAEAEALTLFGQRGKPQNDGSARKLGLALTGALIVVMAMVAFWALFFAGDGEQIAAAPPATEEPAPSEIAAAPPLATEEPAPPEAAPNPAPDPAEAESTPPATEPAPAEPDPAPVATAEAEPPAPEDSATPVVTVQPEPAPEPDAPATDTPVIVTTPATEEGPEPGATDAAVREALLGNEPDPVPEGPLTREAAEARYAATGIWQIAPEPSDAPGSDRLDEVGVTQIDPVIVSAAVPSLAALPDSAVVTPPATSGPPAPAGTVFELDERGLVQATPEGTLSPRGVLVFSGRPTRAPGARPAGLVPPTPADIENERLRGIRPTLRPEGLADPADRTEVTDPTTRTEVAQLAPDAGPDALPTVAPDAPAQAAGLDAAARAEPVETATAEPDSPAQGLDGSELAVLASLFPRERPEDFARRAVAPPPETPAPETPEAEAATAEPEPDSEPAVLAAVAPPQAPSLPSNASVTREATIENGLRLGQVNLIGVYGSSEDRRALVRLPSGRYVKVQVGDRVDGGKVAAIGEDELRYVKGGRSLVLSLPRG